MRNFHHLEKTMLGKDRRSPSLLRISSLATDEPSTESTFKSSSLQPPFSPPENVREVKAVDILWKEINTNSILIRSLVTDIKSIYFLLNELSAEKQQNIKINSKLDATIGNLQLLMKNVNDFEHKINMLQ